MSKNPQSKSIWLVYASHKGGHTYPAKALTNYLNKYFGNIVSAYPVNILEYTSILSRAEKIGRWGDLKLRKIWKAGYKNLHKENKFFIHLWRSIEQGFFELDQVTKRLLKHYPAPDLIISFQPELNIVARYFKRNFAVDFYTVIIDLVVHGLWKDPYVDYYFVYNEAMKEDLIQRGVSPTQISVSGIPLREQFTELNTKGNQKELRKQLKLASELPTILIMGGLLGTMVDFFNVINSILKENLTLQLLVVCGKNELAQKRALEIKRQSRGPIYVYGTVDNIAELMFSSDLVISKPGSVTIAEALALGKPMLVITPEAGSAQELLFAQLLQKEKAGVWVTNVQEVGAELKKLLASPLILENLQQNAQRVGSHSLIANKIISEKIIDLLI
jgi:processive 1,2-diacylglycerol beta-glucosyltransferase